MNNLLVSYLEPMLEKNVDCLVLGCTHYPYLIPQIRKIVGPNIQIIDSGEAVARQTKNILEKYNLLNLDDNLGTHQFYINKNKEALEKLISSSNKSFKVIEKEF